VNTIGNEVIRRVTNLTNVILPDK